jgi:inosine-uridine nucleoside N-ribohydrolase
MGKTSLLTNAQSSGVVPSLKTRGILALGIAAMLLITASCAVSSNISTASKGGKIPVVFDTDICDDIDDTWALIMLLQSPEFDIKLITTAVNNTPEKAKVVARILEIAGRTDIPVGIGVQQNKNNHRQREWVKDYKLSSYPGKVYQDGVQAIVDTIMKSRKPMTVIAVGPLPNIAAALEREPRIAKKARFVGMHGSIYKGYGGSSNISAEYNVKAYPKAAQKVFTAPWDVTITPLDTCGIVHLRGDKYQKVLKANTPLSKALIENYRAWYKQGIIDGNKNLSEEEVNKRVDEKCNSSSTTLFDTVGIYLGMTEKLVKMEKLGIKVTDDGYTRIDNNAKVINCATEWKDLGGFEDFLADRLIR